MTDPLDLAALTAILYAARYQRRVPESEAEKCRTIAESLADARLILAAVTEDEAAGPIGVIGEDPAILSQFTVATPELLPPSPGTIGRKAEAKATRRRG
jgi:hypothetical protein